METIQDVEYHNFLAMTLKFVDSMVENVPAEERGPATASLQAYVDRGRVVLQRGTGKQKNEYCDKMQELLETVKGQMTPGSTESQVIGMSLLGLLGVAAEIGEEDAKFQYKFTEGATQMKAKLSPSTISRESELIQAIDEYINSKDIQVHEALIEKVLSFRNRY